MSMLISIFPSKVVYFCLKTPITCCLKTPTTRTFVLKLQLLAQYVFEQMKAEKKYPPPIDLAVFSLSERV